MGKTICTPGKLLMHYIIDFIVWSIIIGIGFGTIQGILEEFITETFIRLIITLVLNASSNFVVVFLSLRSVFKKYTIANNDVNNFFNKVMIFYIILFIFNILNALLEDYTFLVIAVVSVINAVFLGVLFIYTKNATFKELSKNENINYNNAPFQENPINNNIVPNNQIQNETTQNQNYNEVNNQVQTEQTNQPSGTGYNYANNQPINNLNEDNNTFTNIENNPINNQAINNTYNPNNANDFNNYQTINNQNQIKYCPNCGAGLNIANNFCNQCGYVYNNQDIR